MMKKRKMHRAWLVCVGLLMMQSGVVGVYVNCNGIIFSAILEDLGFRAGDLSVFYTIRNVVSAVAMGVCAKLYFKYNSKLILTLLGSLTVLSLGTMAVYTQLWQWYVSAVLVGISIGGLVIILPMVLGNWFHEKTGFVIGLTVGFSGVAGAIFSPICSHWITAYGWRTTTLLMTAVCVILVVLPAVFLVEASPEALGLHPYGQAQGVAERPLECKHPQAYLFYLLLFVTITMNTVVLFANQLPTYAISVGLTLEVGALYNSWVMVGNVTAKLSLGMLADKFGIYKAMLGMLVLSFTAVTIYWLCADFVAVVCVGSFLFGAVYSLTIAAPPLAVAFLYGRDNYRDKLSKHQSIATFAAAVMGVAIPYSYDLTGSFDLFFAIALVCGLGAMASVWTVDRKTRVA